MQNSMTARNLWNCLKTMSRSERAKLLAQHLYPAQEKSQSYNPLVFLKSTDYYLELKPLRLQQDLAHRRTLDPHFYRSNCRKQSPAEAYGRSEGKFSDCYLRRNSCRICWCRESVCHSCCKSFLSSIPFPNMRSRVLLFI